MTDLDRQRLTAFAATIKESADELAAEAVRQASEHAHALDGLRALLVAERKTHALALDLAGTMVGSLDAALSAAGFPAEGTGKTQHTFYGRVCGLIDAHHRRVLDLEATLADSERSRAALLALVQARTVAGAP